MFRQINLDPQQRHKQRILWRENSSQPVNIFELNTVTYGTAPASYLATRCLYQLGEDNALQFPSASTAIKRYFYMDDLITGGNTLEETRQLIRDINSILSGAQFPLRKWRSNHLELLSDFQNTTDDEANELISLSESKILGLEWSTKTDSLKYSVTFPGRDNAPFKRVTKRLILSTLASIFDPLGLVGPVIILAKLIMQQLWQSKLGWDEAVPQAIHSAWIEFHEKLHCLNDLKIPRYIMCAVPISIEIHGFSDACETGFGCCIYVVSIDAGPLGARTSRLLAAKSRVAPLKSITVVRLELCAALLLAELIHKLLSILNVNFNHSYLWCDSTIVLCWLRKEPSELKTFVANRVSKIQGLTNISDWRHVNSSNNPADKISRGVRANELADTKIWWYGPDFLKIENSHLFENQGDPEMDIDILPDIKPIKITALKTTRADDDFYNTISNKFSSWTKLKRVIAYVLRFTTNSRLGANNKQYGPLTVGELQNARQALLMLTQKCEFQEEMSSLTRNKSLSNSSSLLSLHPFLDQNGLIRVGGRLRKANLPFDQKHPILLPRGSPVTLLIIRHIHADNYHTGPRSTLGIIRNSYWPLGGLNAIKNTIRNCVVCRKSRPVHVTPIMDDLPVSRITPSRPFKQCGTDFAGPFLIKDGKTRNRKTVKAYICLFVCFATKAIHIELVSDLSAEAFILSFKRFISRRGLCSDIHSDNGTNYVGANNEIRELYSMLTKNSDAISDYLAQRSVKWHFIPARSPHFGGLWESAVKGVKKHLSLVLNSNKSGLTFEGLYTVAVQIEAILNSRPLTPISDDPNDLVTLTPGHFLIGEPLLALPEQNVQHVQSNKLQGFRRLQRLHQQFWSQWSRQYLHTLQQRSKWQKAPGCSQLQLGDLVILHDTSPPLDWRMGRITELHPGKDGAVRVVSVRTTTGIIKRSVTKVSPIFGDQDERGLKCQALQGGRHGDGPATIRPQDAAVRSAEARVGG